MFKCMVFRILLQCLLVREYFCLWYLLYRMYYGMITFQNVNYAEMLFVIRFSVPKVPYLAIEEVFHNVKWKSKKP